MPRPLASRARKQIVVAIATADPHRAAEALRAAVGLGLRGDDVAAVFAHPAARRAAGASAQGTKGLATLEALERPVGDESELGALVAAADAVEVWT